MLALVLSSSLLACPPTTVSKGDLEGFWAEYYASPSHEDPAPNASLPPEFPDLPLWDLEATRRELDAIPDGAWLRWTIADATSKPASSHGALVGALSSTTSAARMLWWLAHMPANGDARDALIDAWDRTESKQTRLLLASALALAHWEMSCPGEVGPDGACRMPETSIIDDTLIRRDGIAIERARDWTSVALRLAKRAKLDPGDLAMQALLAELQLASTLDDYEAFLVARPPEGRSWWSPAENSEEIEHGSAFQRSQIDCAREQTDDYERVQHASADAEILVLLRFAKLILALSVSREENARNLRDRQRNRIEHGTWSYTCGPWPHLDMREMAIRHAQRCVEIGTTIGGSTEIVDACWALLEEHDYRYAPLTELVPEPAARTTTMHAAGLVPPPQPSAQQRNPVE